MEGKLSCARCRGWRISAGSKPGRKLEQGLVAAAGGGQLHSAVGAGDGHHRHSRQAEGRGVTQQTAARAAMIRSGDEARNRGAGQQEELMRGEQLVHARVESGVTQSGNFICSDARAPFQPLADAGWMRSKRPACRRAASHA